MVEKYKGTQETGSKQQGGRRASKKRSVPDTRNAYLDFSCSLRPWPAKLNSSHRPSMDCPAETVEIYEGSKQQGGQETLQQNSYNWTVKVQNIESIYLERVDIDRIAKSIEELDDKWNVCRGNKTPWIPGMQKSIWKDLLLGKQNK